MARTTKYPSLYVSEEGDVHEPINFAGTDWAAVEQAYGQSLPRRLRRAIGRCCNRYVSSRHVELRLQSNADAAKELDAMLRKLRPFIDFASSSDWHGTSKATTTTRTVVSREWARALSNQPFRIKADRVRVFSSHSNDWMPVAGNTGTLSALINLDMQTLREIAQSVAVAGKVAKQTFTLAGDGFVPRRALVVWMLEVRDAFKLYNKRNGMQLKYGAYASESDETSNDSAGPFSKMLFEIHGRLPKQYQEPILNGPDALAARLKRALRETRSKLEAETTP